MCGTHSSPIIEADSEVKSIQ